MTYNRSDSEIYVTAETLSKLFEKKFSKIKKTTQPKRYVSTLPQLTYLALSR